MKMQMVVMGTIWTPLHVVRAREKEKRILSEILRRSPRRQAEYINHLLKVACENGNTE
jgi:hypothetical protein